MSALYLRTLARALAASGCFLVVSTGALAEETLAPERLSEIAVLMETLHQDTQSQSMSAAIAIEGEIVFAAGYGAGAPESRYRIGSLSKVISAAIAARLAARGVIDWHGAVDADLDDVELPDATTFRRLADHTGGIRHYRFNEDTVERPPYDSSIEALELFIADAPTYQPGEQAVYSSYGYTLLAAGLEAASGQAFPALLEEEITAPFDLPSIGVDRPGDPDPNNADLYDGLEPITPWDISYKWAAGGLRADVRDLARFAWLFSAADGPVGDMVLSEMTTPGSLQSGEIVEHGAGWVIDRLTTGEAIYFHDGLVQGGRAHMLSVPDWGMSAAIAVNRGSFFSVRHGLDLLCAARGLEDCPSAEREAASQERIGIVINALNATRDRWSGALEAGDLGAAAEEVSDAFDSTQWPNRSALIEALSASVPADGLTRIEGATHMQIGGAETGSLARLTGLYYDQVFTPDANLRFVFQLDGEVWRLIRIEPADE